MKSTLTFDTLQYANTLKDSGMDQQVAEAITIATANAFAEMMETKELATKSDIKDLEVALKKDIRELELATKSDLKDLKIDLIKAITDNTWKSLIAIGAMQGLIIGLYSFVQHLPK